MPGYLIVTQWCALTSLDAAEQSLAPRFPELSVESRVLIPGRGWHIHCHAPSAEHPRRWLAAAGIAVRSVTPQHDLATSADAPLTPDPYVPTTAPTRRDET